MTSRTDGAREAQDKLKVPGWGLHIQHMPCDVFVHGRRVRFPNAVTDFHAHVLTLHELSMLSLMNTLTDKLSWETRIHYPDTVERWRNELIRSPWTPDGLVVSAKAFNYCIEELREKSKNLDTTRTVEVFETPDALVVKSDGAVTQSLRRKVRAAFDSLNQPTMQDEGQTPHTEGMRVVIIDPSLYLCRIGISRVLSSVRLHHSNAVDQCYKGDCWCPLTWEDTDYEYQDGTTRDPHLSMLRDMALNNFWSSYHQWLPADVTWRQGGRSKIANIESYINNLHPSDNEHYTLIECLITLSTPLWNQVLSSLDHDRPRRVVPSSYRAHTPSPPPDLSPSQDEYWEWREDILRCITGPEPGNYAQGRKCPGLSTINLTEDFPSGIQVIVRLESIELTPERPQLAKTDWQVEGMLNEHICAGSIFFYDSENVSEGGMEFRQRSDAQDFGGMSTGDYCENNDLESIMGIERGDDAYQYLGRMTTPEGRLLAFPNVLQTRTPTIRLKDPHKPGHCRFLTLLLVDSYIRILSTANVTPRRRDWWARAIYPDPRHRLGILPPELFNRIIDYATGEVGFTSLQDAISDKAKREVELAKFREALNNHVEEFWVYE